MRNSSDSKLQKALLRKHRLHAGLYVRVATRLGLHQSYVSKVAHRKLSSLKISRAFVGGAKANRADTEGGRSRVPLIPLSIIRRSGPSSQTLPSRRTLCQCRPTS